MRDTGSTHARAWPFPRNARRPFPWRDLRRPLPPPKWRLHRRLQNERPWPPVVMVAVPIATVLTIRATASGPRAAMPTVITAWPVGRLRRNSSLSARMVVRFMVSLDQGFGWERLGPQDTARALIPAVRRRQAQASTAPPSRCAAARLAAAGSHAISGSACRYGAREPRNLRDLNPSAHRATIWRAPRLAAFRPLQTICRPKEAQKDGPSRRRMLHATRGDLKILHRQSASRPAAQIS